MAMDEWSDAYETVSINAKAAEWFVSPLEYHWPDGKRIADAIFQPGLTPNAGLDEIVPPQLFRSAMQVDFRSKMMVYAFMRQPIAQSFGMEIESGLLALYRLDFLECLSQWTFIVEGFCRQLFAVSSPSSIKSSGWTIPVTGDASRDKMISVVANASASYLDGIAFASSSNTQSERMNRHVLLHGNVRNRKFFSQKNCMIMMFVLDALVFIEMVKNRAFPSIFHSEHDEDAKIDGRKRLYMLHLEHAFADENLLKIQLLNQHP